MSKYLLDFQSTGVSKLNIELVLLDWNNRFFLSQYKDTFKFAISSRKRNCLDLKVEISKEQFDEILLRKKLVKVQDTFFRHSISYFTKSHLEKEVLRLNKIHDYHKGIANAAKSASENYADALFSYSGA